MVKVCRQGAPARVERRPPRASTLHLVPRMANAGLVNGSPGEMPDGYCPGVSMVFEGRVMPLGLAEALVANPELVERLVSVDLDGPEWPEGQGSEVTYTAGPAPLARFGYALASSAGGPTEYPGQ